MICYHLKSKLDAFRNSKMWFNHKLFVQYKNYCVSYIVQEVRIITSFPGLGNYEANPGLKSTPKTPVHAGSELTNILYFYKKKYSRSILLEAKFTDLTDL